MIASITTTMAGAKEVDVELGANQSLNVNIGVGDRKYRVVVRLMCPLIPKIEDRVDDVIVYVGKPVGGSKVVRGPNLIWHGDDIIWDRLSVLGGSSAETWFAFGANSVYSRVTNDPNDPYEQASEEVMKQIRKDEA